MNNNEYICFNQNDYKIFSYIDDCFRELAIEHFNANELYVPSLISEQVLKKANYISSFPHQLTIASYIDKNYSLHSKKIQNSNLYLTPSACLHIYPMLENKAIKNCAFTTRAQVYRHESEDFDGRTRLWNFTVREIVFVGGEDFVKSSLKTFELYVLDFVEKFDLNIKILPATDHFYPTKENIIKEKMQLTNSLKKELICNINGQDISLASFNFHGFHFSKPFNFDSNSSIVSGCIGFGLERWIAALKRKNLIGKDKK